MEDSRIGKKRTEPEREPKETKRLKMETLTRAVVAGISLGKRPEPGFHELMSRAVAAGFWVAKDGLCEVERTRLLAGVAEYAMSVFDEPPKPLPLAVAQVVASLSSVLEDELPGVFSVPVQFVDAADGDVPPLIGGFPFDVTLFQAYGRTLGEDRVERLSRLCKDKCVFGLISNPYTKYKVREQGPSWCTLFIIRALRSNPDIADKIISGEIPLEGQALSSVVPNAYSAWENKAVVVYEAGDFSELGVTDEELLRCCEGYPVFAPDENQPITREWARETVRELARDEILRPQILAGKLRFLGQPLSEVVKGARAEKMLFTKEDFSINYRHLMYKQVRLLEQMTDMLVGSPVFLPEEGCEYVLAKKGPGGRPHWPGVVVALIKDMCSAAEGFPLSELPVDGRRVTDIPLPRLPALNEGPDITLMRLHLFGSQQRWQASYERRLIGVDDFPLQKPDWAAWAMDSDYLELLRNVAERPVVTADDSSVEALGLGFYNEKHHRLFDIVKGVSSGLIQSTSLG